MALIIISLLLTLVSQTCQADHVNHGCTNLVGSHCYLDHLTETRIPQGLDTSITRLFIENSAIAKIENTDFQNYPKLLQISFTAMPQLHYVDGSAFDILTELRYLEFNKCPNLAKITGNITQSSIGTNFILKIINSNLKKIPNLRQTNPGLQTFSIVSFRNNRITQVNDGIFANLHIEKIILSYNYQLTRIQTDAFTGIRKLRNLDISNTSVEILPKRGLDNLEILWAVRVFTMKQLPPLESFANLKTAYLTYPYHCCMFKNAMEPSGDSNVTDLSPITHEVGEKCAGPTIQIIKRFPRAYLHDFQLRKRFRTPLQDRIHQQAALRRGMNQHRLKKTKSKTSKIKPVWNDGPAVVASQVIMCLNMSPDTPNMSAIVINLRKVVCSPQPDRLNPCADIMENSGLRLVVWCVWLIAVSGNLAVLVVVARKWPHQYKEMRVLYFAILNLAIGDLIVGVYLGMLAVKDVLSLSDYYNSAVDWQTGWGCNVAGFLAILGSELSLFSLFVVAFDYYLKIALAAQNYRLNFFAVILLMALGWTVALTLAVLPLLNVNSYGHTALCLPLRDDLLELGDRMYLGLILAINLVLLVAISGLYIASFFAQKQAPIEDRDPQDIYYAKYFAILITTNMMCWFPAILIGLTALFGARLITISTAKYLLVIFLPINSMTDPFIYAAWSSLRKYLENRSPNSSMRSLMRRSMDWSNYYTSEAQSSSSWRASVSSLLIRKNSSSYSSSYFGNKSRRATIRTQSESSMCFAGMAGGQKLERQKMMVNSRSKTISENLLSSFDDGGASDRNS